MSAMRAGELPEVPAALPQDSARTRAAARWTGTGQATRAGCGSPAAEPAAEPAAPHIRESRDTPARDTPARGPLSAATRRANRLSPATRRRAGQIGPADAGFQI